MCTKGSGTNSVKPPVSRWRSRVRSRCVAQLVGTLDRAEHDRDVRAQARRRGPTRCTSSHWSLLILSGQSMARTSSSRISAAVPGSVLSPASFRRVRYVARSWPERRAPSKTSSALKAWMWMRRRAGPHRRHDVDVVLAVEVRVDPALQADLGRAAGLGLAHPLADLLQGQR